MDAEEPRVALERLIRERREDYSGLSRLIGRNAAYIQQFIKRGVPRKLDEEDRRTLARYFNVDEELLGGRPGEPVQTSSADRRLVPIARYDIGASAGPGRVVGGEASRFAMSFDEAWLRELGRGPASQLSIIRVEGDSMAPSLGDGDDIMVDGGDGAERLRDGIYVLRRDEVLMVKRLAVNPATKSVTIKSDNPAYPDWPDSDMSDVAIIGRVIWAGRKLR